MENFRKNDFENDEPYLFYPQNIDFVNGLTKWTGQNKRNVFELLSSIPLTVLLFIFLLVWDFEVWLKIFLLVFFGAVVFSLTAWFYFKIRRGRNLANNGKVVAGEITECLLTDKGSDTDIFEVKYVFGNKHSSFETHLERKLAENLPGRKILVLYSDESNFLVL